MMLKLQRCPADLDALRSARPEIASLCFMAESVHRGVEGPLRDAWILAGPWGFEPEDVKAEVHLLARRRGPDDPAASLRRTCDATPPRAPARAARARDICSTPGTWLRSWRRPRGASRARRARRWARRAPRPRAQCSAGRTGRRSIGSQGRPRPPRAHGPGVPRRSLGSLPIEPPKSAARATQPRSGRRQACRRSRQSTCEPAPESRHRGHEQSPHRRPP